MGFREQLDSLSWIANHSTKYSFEYHQFCPFSSRLLVVSHSFMYAFSFSLTLFAQPLSLAQLSLFAVSSACYIMYGISFCSVCVCVFVFIFLCRCHYFISLSRETLAPVKKAFISPLVHSKVLLFFYISLISFRLPGFSCSSFVRSRSFSFLVPWNEMKTMLQLSFGEFFYVFFSHYIYFKGYMSVIA